MAVRPWRLSQSRGSEDGGGGKGGDGDGLGGGGEGGSGEGRGGGGEGGLKLGGGGEDDGEGGGHGPMLPTTMVSALAPRTLRNVA